MKTEHTTETCSLSRSEVQELYDTLGAASGDIGEHLRVAKYNLRGECCGQIMERPNPPQLVHEHGIAVSEAVRERIRKVCVRLHEPLGLATRLD